MYWNVSEQLEKLLRMKMLSIEFLMQQCFKTKRISTKTHTCDVKKKWLFGEVCFAIGNFDRFDYQIDEVN